MDVPNRAGEPAWYSCTSLRALTVREVWRLTPWKIAFPLTLLIKALRVPMPVESAHAVEQPMIIEWEELPPDAQTHFTALAGDLAPQRVEWSYCYESLVIGPAKITAAVYAANDDAGWGLAVWNHSSHPNFRKTTRMFSMLSRLRDDRLLVTTNAKPELDSGPWVEGERLVGRDAPEVVRRHADRVAECRLRIVPTPPHEIPDANLAMETREARHLIGRGVMTPLPPAQVAALRQRYPG